MIRSFAILAPGLWIYTGSQGQSTKSEVRIRAIVQAVSPLATFSGKMTRVSGDPRFALDLRIESATPTVGNFKAGAVVTLGIRSPSMLFNGESPKGRTYDFVMQRDIEGGRVRYFGLTVH